MPDQQGRQTNAAGIYVTASVPRVNLASMAVCISQATQLQPSGQALHAYASAGSGGQLLLARLSAAAYQGVDQPLFGYAARLTLLSGWSNLLLACSTV